MKAIKEFWRRQREVIASGLLKLVGVVAAFAVAALSFGDIAQITTSTRQIGATFFVYAAFGLGLLMAILWSVLRYLDSGSEKSKNSGLAQEISDEIDQAEAQGIDPATLAAKLEELRQTVYGLTQGDPGPNGKGGGSTPLRAPVRRPPTPGMVTRLKNEIRDQGKRANLNLGLGIIAAIISAGVLLWLTVLASNNDTPAQHHFIMRYWGGFASKVLLSSTFSLFAIFFLSTYRRNLSEIRYFHNELTNLDARLYAVKQCEDAKSEATKMKILEGMGATERNFILKKGETTIDLLQKQMDHDDVLSMLQFAENLTELARDLKPDGTAPARKPAAKPAAKRKIAAKA